MSDSAELLLKPEPKSWASLLREPSGHGAGFRKQMGLPSDGPIVMSGHQGEFWHPGIVAKLFAGHAFARSVDGSLAWLVVDQDDNDPTKIRVPVQGADGTSGVRVWEMIPEAMVPSATPTRCRPAFEPAAFDGEPHPGTQADAINSIRAGLSTHASEPSLAHQVSRAALGLLEPNLPTPSVLFACDLHETDLFGEILESIHHDPRAAVQAYNDACEAFADAGMRPLTIRDDVIELPLWRIRPGEARMPVYSTQLSEIPRNQLAPRALLMTAIVRMRGCDLFIHGTGGGAYDRITEQWIESWLGEQLAPTVVASATCTLRIADQDVPTEAQIAEARARAHSARHDPAVVGDTPASEQKAALIAEIERTKQAGQNPAPLFRQMQELLAEYRERSAAKIGELEAEGERMESLKVLSAIANDRTWASALYPGEVLDGLRAQIEQVFGVSQ